MATKIEWADETINPIRTADGGYHCTKVSEGCQRCYAETMNNRFGNHKPFDSIPARFVINHKQLEYPLHWRKSRKIFVQSMGDLFHEDVPDWAIDEVLSVMLACKVLNNTSDHQFMFLTKRPDRMSDYFNRDPAELLKRWAESADGFIVTDDPDVLFSELVYSAVCHNWDKNGSNSSGSEYKPWGYPEQIFPLSNLWLGVTAENQQRADERIPILLQIPAAKRFVSVEPMLGSVDLNRYLYNRRLCDGHAAWECDEDCPRTPRLDQVICGGETGPGARPMHPNWVRSLRDQCQAAGVPFFFKSWGDWSTEYPQDLTAATRKQTYQHGTVFYGVGKKKAGNLLDGVKYSEYPGVRA